MINRIVERIYRTSFVHILWISVAVSMLMTAVIVAPLSVYFHGAVTNDYMITGMVTSFFVSTVVVSLIIAFVNHMRLADKRHQADQAATSAVNMQLAAAVEQTG